MRKFLFKDPLMGGSIMFLMVFSSLVLNSLDNTLFPQYFLYIFLGIAVFIIFSLIDFDIISLFSKHFYIISLVLLAGTLILGQVTRGTVRWIQLGAGSFQPAELVRPFLLLFFANYLGGGEISLKKFGKALFLLIIPVVLILVQPSLGVSILTTVGFLGVLLASRFKKKYILIGFLICLALLPVGWKVMAPYQKERITTFLNPTSDPKGAGYNSIQATIAAGSGKIFGTGLGKGVQTQLAFLPEKQTDFIFASTAEELGLFGVLLVLTASFIILWRLTKIMENSINPSGRAYVAGFFLTYILQIFVHAGMNMGMLPITGLPFPLLSAGGSSLLATMIGFGIALGAYKKN